MNRLGQIRIVCEGEGSFVGNGELLLLELRLGSGNGVVCQTQQTRVLTYSSEALTGPQRPLRATLLSLRCADTKNLADYVGARLRTHAHGDFLNDSNGPTALGSDYRQRDTNQ